MQGNTRVNCPDQNEKRKRKQNNEVIIEQSNERISE